MSRTPIGVLFALNLLSAPFAATASPFISGQVVDSRTGNPVSDVNITIEGAPVGGAATDLTGRFQVEAPAPGISVILNVSHIAFKEARVGAAAGDVPIYIELEPRDHRLAGVVVSSGRRLSADRTGAVTGIDNRQLTELNGVTEPPLLALKVPNATFFNWGGHTVGATHIKIRGFDSNRLSVSINGIPINDPEDHNVYWQDIPDFLSNTNDIQVTRGINTFGAGPAGIGGGLNLVTSDAVSRRETAVSLQSGSFNTRRHTLLYRSGLVGERYNITGRFSRIRSDGYRDHSSADEWSYLLAATRYDPKLITQIQTFGGVEDTDLNFTAISKAEMDTNRTWNPSANYGRNYDGERDHFVQPHYILRNTYQAAPSLTLSHSLFWIKGDGYYEQFKRRREFAVYNLTPFDRYEDANGDGVVDTVTVDWTDLVQRKYVEKNQIGWMPQAEWSLAGGGQFAAGLELRRYKAEHFGRIIWAAELPTNVNPEHEWYRWRSQKDYRGIWGRFSYPAAERFILNVGLELRNIAYEVEQDLLGLFDGHRYDVDWTFANPRLGVTFQPSDPLEIYASLSRAGREPIDEQILNADNPDDVPKLPKFNYPEVKPEAMTDLEGGVRLWLGGLEASAGLYAMFFTDEILYSGAYDPDLDELVVTNAKSSNHLGIEVTMNYAMPLEGLSLGGDVSLDRSTFGEFTYTYVDPDYNEHPMNLKGNRVPLTPDLVANGRVRYDRPPAVGELSAHYVSRQYLDGREVKSASLDPYILLNGLVIIRLPAMGGNGSLEFELRGMNLLDEEYEPFGWVEVGEPKFIPAAGRSWLAGVTVRL